VSCTPMQDRLVPTDQILAPALHVPCSTNSGESDVVTFFTQVLSDGMLVETLCDRLTVRNCTRTARDVNTFSAPYSCPLNTPSARILVKAPLILSLSKTDGASIDIFCLAGGEVFQRATVMITEIVFSMHSLGFWPRLVLMVITVSRKIQLIPLLSTCDASSKEQLSVRSTNAGVQRGLSETDTEYVVLESLVSSLMYVWNPTNLHFFAVNLLSKSLVATVQYQSSLLTDPSLASASFLPANAA
jgi:hypothetical protein